jgi:hypothetical protein
VHWLGRHQDKRVPGPGAFLLAVLGLTTSQQEADFAAFQLPEGAPSRCSALGDQDHEHFSTSPMVGLLVDDLAAAVPELEAVRGGAAGRAGGRAPRRMAPFSRCTGCGEPARFSHLLGACTD